MDLPDHLRRQMAFSRATYGPGERTAGVCDHIGKELREIHDAPDDGLRSREWVDVVILGFDGLWRALEAEGVPWAEIPERVADLIRAKQSKNEQREWPDWRTAPKGRAIEHVRIEEPSDDWGVATNHGFLAVTESDPRHSAVYQTVVSDRPRYPLREMLKEKDDTIARLTAERDAARTAHDDATTALADHIGVIMRLGAENERLREALAPFAAMHAALSAAQPKEITSDCDHILWVRHEGKVTFITPADFARAALRETTCVPRETET